MSVIHPKFYSSLYRAVIKHSIFMKKGPSAESTVGPQESRCGPEVQQGPGRGRALGSVPLLLLVVPRALRGPLLVWSRGMVVPASLVWGNEGERSSVCGRAWHLADAHWRPVTAVTTMECLAPQTKPIRVNLGPGSWHLLLSGACTLRVFGGWAGKAEVWTARWGQ